MVTLVSISTSVYADINIGIDDTDNRLCSCVTLSLAFSHGVRLLYVRSRVNRLDV